MSHQAAKNEAAIRSFAEQFDPPLKVVGTQNIDGRRHANAFMAAFWDQEHEIGITAHCWGKGHFRAFVEVTGSSDVSQDAGIMMAKALKLYGTTDAE